MCDLTHPYVWHESSICVASHMNVSHIHSYVWRDPLAQHTHLMLSKRKTPRQLWHTRTHARSCMSENTKCQYACKYVRRYTRMSVHIAFVCMYIHSSDMHELMQEAACLRMQNVSMYLRTRSGTDMCMCMCACMCVCVYLRTRSRTDMCMCMCVCMCVCVYLCVCVCAERGQTCCALFATTWTNGVRERA